MTGRRPCPVAPGPLEGYAARFDDLFTRMAQRRGFREYLAGLLAPRDRNKTLTVVAGAQPAAVQRLQFFLSESPGTRSGSMPAGWSCYGPIRRPRRMMRGCW